MNNCKFCNEETTNSSYCSNKCQQAFQSATKRENYLNGKYVGKSLFYRTGEWTRNLLIEHKGYSCSVCFNPGIWQGKPLVLEVNHIDGDALNNCIENTEFVCPNCHCQTDTHRAKNIGNGKRKYKSYR